MCAFNSIVPKLVLLCTSDRLASGSAFLGGLRFPAELHMCQVGLSTPAISKSSGETRSPLPKAGSHLTITELALRDTALPKLQGSSRGSLLKGERWAVWGAFWERRLPRFTSPRTRKDGQRIWPLLPWITRSYAFTVKLSRSQVFLQRLFLWPLTLKTHVTQGHLEIRTFEPYPWALRAFSMR